MEAPVWFHVLGKVIPAKRQEALDIIRRQAVFRDEARLRRAVMESVRENKAMQLSPAMRFRDAQSFAAGIEGIFDDVAYSQEGYDTHAQFCPTYNFYSGVA